MEKRKGRKNERATDFPTRKGPASVSALAAREVSQEEIRQASVLQAMAWAADRRAHRFILNLEKRLERGASVEAGPLEYDRDLHMVRTRKVG